ncbi:hypothetical protein QQZ08_010112 [Neonectria magnoliae]|uniref:Uncharacterized protein n=1 Tax=Neonectria magnoliae TaxID=2732573 RepID=A0ABR1HIV2_9HYPO
MSSFAILTEVKAQPTLVPPARQDSAVTEPKRNGVQQPKNIRPRGKDHAITADTEARCLFEKLGHENTPLLPLAVSRRLIQNSAAEVMAEHQLLALQSFVTLLDAQYATSSVDHAGKPARWALVNTVIALALRVKTAPGSEAKLSDIPRAYYRNATTVIPDLILQDSSLLLIQALLTMAIFS